MSSALRLSIIMVLSLATFALGLIAYNMNQPKPVVPVTQNAPAAPTSRYFVAAHPLPAGTLARDEDFEVRSAPSGGAPSGAILDTPEARTGLRGSLVRNFLDAGSPVTSQDILRPRDRGFLASVLAPDSRAVSIIVDAEVRRLGPDLARRLCGCRVDPGERQGGSRASLAERNRSSQHSNHCDRPGDRARPSHAANNAAAGKVAHSVSLQLAPEQVKKIAVAKELGKLSLAIRSAVEQQDTADAGTMFGCDVSPEIARQSAIARQRATVVGLYRRQGQGILRQKRRYIGHER